MRARRDCDEEEQQRRRSRHSVTATRTEQLTVPTLEQHVGLILPLIQHHFLILDHTNMFE